MLIDENILAAHRELSACSAQFICHIQGNPDYLSRSHYKMLAKHDQSTYEFPYTLQPWPTFVDKRTSNKMSAAVIRVQGLITSIPERLFSYNFEKMSAYFEMPINKLKTLMEGTTTSVLGSGLGRGDFILASNGQFKCLELNLSPDVGGWQIGLMEQQYLKEPVIATFLDKYQIRCRPNHLFESFFSYLLREYNKKSVGRYNDVNVAIVVPKPQKYTSLLQLLNRVYQITLKILDPRLKGSVFICESGSLTLGHNSLLLGESKICIIIDAAGLELPCSWSTLAKNGQLQLYNGPTTEVMHNKLHLALLSEHQESELFTHEERRAIASYIPWTRKTVPGLTNYGAEKVQLEKLALCRRERLVLKHALKGKGCDVYVGRYTAAHIWAEKIRNALVEKVWILQEFVPSQSYYYQIGSNECAPHHVVWGLFVFGNVYGGAWARILPKASHLGVINSAQGAEESSIIELDQ